MRNAIVAGVMVLVVVIMVWAGIRNLHTRRAQEAAEASKPMTITVDKAGATATSAEESGAAPDLRGKPAADFTLTSTDGKQVQLSSLKGKAVMVNFWATWCAPCKIEMPWFEEFHKKYAAQGFEILGIDEDDDIKSSAIKASIARTIQNTGVTYPILLPDKKVSENYGGLDVLPATYFIDRSGKIVAQTIGLAPKGETEANIQKILASN